MNKIKLHKVHFLPKELDSGILYVSEEFGVAGHLCPCGCGSKIITPLEPTEWSFSEVNGEPTLYPSIGNWQLPCRSHYWIRRGKIEWSYPWTEEQVRVGKQMEEKQRRNYFNKIKKSRKRNSILANVSRWFKK